MLHRHLLLVGFAAGATLLAAASAVAHSGGPNNGLAAQPGNFANCTQCHSTNAVNSGNGSFSLSGAPAFYTPGQTYNLTVTIQDPGQSRWGFELVALRSNDSNAGTLASTGATVQTSTDGLGRIFAKHTSAGTFSGTAGGPVSWNVDWTAPTVGAGTVSFYAAGNAANNNFSNSGDFIYTAATASAEDNSGVAVTMVVQPDDPTPNRGGSLAVRARVRNHQNVSDNLVVVSRLRLATGGFYPTTGWLLAPASITVLPAGQSTVNLVNAVPAAAPLLTATYEALVGRLPSTLLSVDTFTVQVQP
ncbi:MAG: hypothetical protein H8E31_11325 [Planctomycetes bacterium]|nr:hypothetical protein [Planctomycetota bacterium]